eukprot:TRINITY_DN1085_c1_g1_i1.p1 TRINITY_DN1085_c1_g1~~TRINITY_DN1085_c1_g1_i1.p1  ORF type:complete len:402 (+),score=76.29 TRINITY_DN1085_c1_g1_i1:38-1207(+)
MPRERESRSRRSGSKRRRRRSSRSRSVSPLAAPSLKVGGGSISPYSRKDVKAPPVAAPPREFISPERSVPPPASYAPFTKSPVGGTASRSPGAVVKMPPHSRAAPPLVVVPGSLRSPDSRTRTLSSRVRFGSESPVAELESERSERYHSSRADVESYRHSEPYTPRRSYRSPRRESYSRSPRRSTSPRRPTFDTRDRAPEDRFYEVSNQQQPFGPHQRVVRGSFIIEGLNYAIYEAAGEGSDSRRRFTTALRDDIIATVGQGVRRGDIMLRAAPGPVKGVTLEFDRGTHPAIVDANWGIEFEYAIRSRDEIAQQRVGMTLFSALQDPHGLDLLETRKCWMRYLDPNTHPGGIIAIPVPQPVPEYPSSPPPQSHYYSEYGNRNHSSAYNY